MVTTVNETRITCPKCGFSKVETMAVNACRRFYRCDGCGEVLRPLAGDCCVFCSYADVPCPPNQTAAASIAPGCSDLA